MSPGAEPRLVLRRMLAADLDAVVEVERAAHRYPWSADLIRRELDHDWSTVLLALASVEDPTKGQEISRLAGHIIFWLVHDEIHILNVATHPDFRRRGYARAMMLAAEEKGRPRGAALSTLEVRKSNEAALELYRSLDYRQVGLRPRYYADDEEDAIVMLKDLRPREDGSAGEGPTRR
jgi:ribosomal-protein-alanine N-acetyltransferase